MTAKQKAKRANRIETNRRLSFRRRHGKGRGWNRDNNASYNHEGRERGRRTIDSLHRAEILMTILAMTS